MKLRCLIVDDEPIAREIVEKYCSFLPEIEVVSSCNDALQAKQLLAVQPVDVIFLDINMPVLDGLAFLKTLKKQPQVIFTTAYKEYAHEAFNISACDYLLKPFSFDRFIQAVDKAKSQIGLQQADPGVPEPHTGALYIRSEGKILKFDVADVRYAEAQGNHVKIVTGGGVFATATTFSAFEEQLPKGDFIRVHRSFIVNKSKIRIIEGNRIFIGDTEIPIGQNFRDQFFKSLGLR